MVQSFSDLALPRQLLHALERASFTTPTPIQAQAIPLALEGKDVLGSAQTGTGKTGAFGIPLIAKLMEDQEATAVILTPTRELAAQVMNAMQQWIAVPHIKTALLIGGEPMPKQYRQLRMNPRLIVGTPGRVNDHLLRKSLNLSNTRFLVLDETDRMLDMGFGIQLDAILKFLPEERQTMMFSATMPANIMKLSAKYLNNPQRVAVGSVNAPVAKIRQELVQTTEAEKYSRLMDELARTDGSVIVFVKTKFGADKLATKLYRDEHKAEAIHGDLKQNRRDRVIQGFRDKKYRVLVATDVAARGLDIPHIAVVINYDLPQAPEDYIHRIGRTARAGAEGYAVNLVAPADGAKWKAIHRLLNPGAQSNDTRSERPNKGRDNNRGGFGGGYNKGFGGRSNGDSNGSEKAFPGFKPRNTGFGKPRTSNDGYVSRDGYSRDNQQQYRGDGYSNQQQRGDGYSRDGQAPKRAANGSAAKPFGAKPFGAKPFGAKPKFGGNKPHGNGGNGNAGGGKPFGKSAPRRFAKKPARAA